MPYTRHSTCALSELFHSDLETLRYILLSKNVGRCPTNWHGVIIAKFRSVMTYGMSVLHEAVHRRRVEGKRVETADEELSVSAVVFFVANKKTTIVDVGCSWRQAHSCGTCLGAWQWRQGTCRLESSGRVGIERQQFKSSGQSLCHSENNDYFCRQITLYGNFWIF